MRKISLTNRSKLNHGFSLVEMTISMGILVALLGVLLSAFGSIVDVQLESKKASSVDQDSRYLIAKLTHDFQSASSIVTPATPGSATSLTLKNSSDSLNYTYSLSSGDLQSSDGSTANRLNSIDTSISALNFKRVGPGTTDDTVQVSFTITSKTTLRGVADTRNITTTLAIQ